MVVNSPGLKGSLFSAVYIDMKANKPIVSMNARPASHTVIWRERIRIPKPFVGARFDWVLRWYFAINTSLK